MTRVAEPLSIDQTIWGANVKMSARNTIFGAAVCAAAIVGLGAGTAGAGEVTGQGRGTPIISEDGPSENVGHFGVEASACAFSGLEDAAGPGVTQTPKGAGAFTGIACRGPARGAVRP
jgi:hypothetical protein